MKELEKERFLPYCDSIKGMSPKNILVILLVQIFIFPLNLYCKNKDLIFFGKILDYDPLKKTVLLNFKNKNIKFVKRDDEVFFYNDFNPRYKCRGRLLKGTYSQLVLKVKHFKECSKNVGFVKYSFVKIESEDLKKNIQMANDVVDVLLKKRLILQNKIGRLQHNMQTKSERREYINAEFEAKISSLKLDWKNALEELDYGDHDAERDISQSQLKIQEIDRKLRIYNVESKRIKKSQWSLHSGKDQL